MPISLGGLTMKTIIITVVFMAVAHMGAKSLIASDTAEMLKENKVSIELALAK